MGKTLLLLIVLASACKSSKDITQVLPVAAIDSIGKVSVFHSTEITYIPDGDTLIHRNHIPLPDYQDSTITIRDGRMTVRIPKAAKKIVKQQTTVEIPIYKENLDRVRQLHQKNDSLQKKNQEVGGRLSRMQPYKVIVWALIGGLAAFILLLAALGWMQGKFGWIGNGIKNIFGTLSRVFTRKK